MKQGVCHLELPIARAGRTQRRIGFIFQIAFHSKAAPFGDSGHIARAMRNADADPSLYERPIANGVSRET